LSEIQVSNDWYGEDDDGKVGRDVDGCVGATKVVRIRSTSWYIEYLQPHCILVQAASFLSSPECPHGHTSKDAAENRPESVGNDYAHDCPVEDLELLRREDPSILEEHRAFCQP
jgi:hypothetical protein